MKPVVPPRIVPPRITLDATDHEIIRALEGDARMSWADLGRTVQLSAPSARERVRRMERAGVITGYGAWIDPARVSKPIGAFVRVTTPTPQRNERLQVFAHERGEIVEMHRLTGDDSVIMRVQVSDISELDRLTKSLGAFGKTTTSLILDSPIPWRNVLARQR